MRKKCISCFLFNCIRSFSASNLVWKLQLLLLLFSFSFSAALVWTTWNLAMSTSPSQQPMAPCLLATWLSRANPPNPSRAHLRVPPLPRWYARRWSVRIFLPWTIELLVSSKEKDWKMVSWWFKLAKPDARSKKNKQRTSKNCILTTNRHHRTRKHFHNTPVANVPPLPANVPSLPAGITRKLSKSDKRHHHLRMLAVVACHDMICDIALAKIQVPKWSHFLGWSCPVINFQNQFGSHTQKTAMKFSLWFHLLRLGGSFKSSMNNMRSF